MALLREHRIEDLRRELRPARLGHRTGDRGEPPLEASEDPAQNEIAEHVESLRAEAEQTVSDLFKESRKHWEQLEQSEPRSDFSAVVNGARTRFDEIAQREGDDLNDARFHYKRLHREFHDFRDQNDIDRQPAGPSVPMRWVMIAILVTIFLGESLLNATFLAVGSETGFLGGYGIAFGFSLLNVLTPFLVFGNAHRWVYHMNLWKRLMAWLSTVVYVALASCLNLALAHWREASADLSEDVGAEALGRLLESPFGLQDLESWLLVVMGLFFSGVAFLEGYKYHDAYPGYGRKDQKMREARNVYYDRREEVVEQLAELRDESLDRIRQIASEARRKPKELQRILDGREELLGEYGEHFEQLQRLGTTLIAEYREANHRARPDQGTPAVHRTEWRLAVGAAPLWTPSATPLELSEEDLERLSLQQQAANEQVHAMWRSICEQIDPGGSEARNGIPLSGSIDSLHGKA